jgi:hypothetical protein
LLHCVIFDCFHIFKSTALQGVLDFGEEKKVTGGHVRGVWGLTHVECGLAECVCVVVINLPLTNLPFSGVIYGKLNHRAILVIPNKIAGV